MGSAPIGYGRRKFVAGLTCLLSINCDVVRAQADTSEKLPRVVLELNGILSNSNSGKLQLELTNFIGKRNQIIIKVGSASGDAQGARSIWSFITSSNLEFNTYSDGILTIYPLVLFMLGRQRLLSQNAKLLFSPPEYHLVKRDLTESEFRDAINKNESFIDQIAEFLQKKTKLSKKSAIDLINNGSVLDAHAAIDMGIATDIGDVLVQPDDVEWTLVDA